MADRRAPLSKAGAPLLALAATLGTLPVALLASAAVARFFPLFSEDVRFALGFGLAIPLWITATCAAIVARTPTRAWLFSLGVSVVLGALVFGVPH